ncbi:response regulator [Actinospica sp. MGRD01-02]|uniref:Response regulator n=2 Tax=Actinospica acidithermotolerans TaxID=2828514 RepID=A0A941EGK1_9ACTN|nr:response regulator [Actinospica acidithermotolerans]
MRAFQAGDTSARAPEGADIDGRAAADGAGAAEGTADAAVAAELCALFNAIADRVQALESAAAGEHGGEHGGRDERDERSGYGGRGTSTDTQRLDFPGPAIPEADRTPAILVIESVAESDLGAPGDLGAAGVGEPMREAAQTALRGLGGDWDQADVVRVDSTYTVRDAAVRHRVVSVLIDARAPLDLLLTLVAVLDATVPGVPLLCFAPDGDPTAFDTAVAVLRGRSRAEIVRSPVQAVERLTLHWLTQAPVAPDPLAESAESGYGQIRFEGEKVLVIDDDVRNVFAMVSALELYGLTALTADNGPEGVELLLRNPDISVVLMDLMMPGLDGYATTALIRSHPEFADLPIIAVTARAAPGDRERSLAAGTDEHVTKPVEVDRLLALIKRLLKRSQPRT